MREVVFVDAARSAFANMGGGFKKLFPSEIAGFVIREFAKRYNIYDNGKLDAVFAGMAMGEKVPDPARYATLSSGLPVETEAHFVEMQCGSAIAAINHAAAFIATGQSDAIMAGGMESYSQIMAYFRMDVEPYKLIPPTAVVLRHCPDEAENIDMISVSEKMAKMWGISRSECDEFALQSQQRMAEAYKKGITGPEIVPYVIPATKKTPEIIINKDEYPRPNTTMESLSNLRPVYEGGVTTAGNASGRNDGAAFLLMVSADKAKEWGLKPYARWVTGADAGCAPSIMGIGPAYSNVKAMRRAGLSLEDLEVIECNEAFASQNLGVIKEMEKQLGKKIDRSKWNPNGGAIAIGHPNGASGARIGWFAMKQLEYSGSRYGLFGACTGGGQGVSVVIENLRR